MALSSLQSKILRLLAAHRDPESYVAGSIPLHYGDVRSSGDIDIFHDREERVGRAAREDSAILEAEGFTVIWLRREPQVYTAEIREGDAFTRLEWVVDSDFRFFPTLKDELFGYVLHPVDLAANKVMAAVGRRKPADLVDLLTIHDHILPLGAVVWAAVEKAPGFTPEGLIAEIRRTSNYRAEELQTVPTAEPIDPKVFYARLREVLDDAEAFVSRMPTEKAGLLFLKDGRVVQPDPGRLDDYATHAGQRRGHWPGSPEIAAAMLDHYERHPPAPGKRT
jgi:hypothetical protein